MTWIHAQVRKLGPYTGCPDFRILARDQIEMILVMSRFFIILKIRSFWKPGATSMGQFKLWTSKFPLIIRRMKFRISEFWAVPIGNKIKDWNPVTTQTRQLNEYKSSIGIWLKISEFFNRFSYLNKSIQFLPKTWIHAPVYKGYYIREYHLVIGWHKLERNIWFWNKPHYTVTLHILDFITKCYTLMWYPL